MNILTQCIIALLAINTIIFIFLSIIILLFEYEHSYSTYNK